MFQEDNFSLNFWSFQPFGARHVSGRQIFIEFFDLICVTSKRGTLKMESKCIILYLRYVVRFSQKIYSIQWCKCEITNSISKSKSTSKGVTL